MQQRTPFKSRFYPKKKPEVQITAPQEIYFIKTDEILPDESYARMKKQIDETWPKHLLRPMLLEKCDVVKL